MGMNLLKIPPKGIDMRIQRHQGSLYGHLKNDLYSSVLTGDSDYESYGRSEKLEDASGYYPAVYLRSDEYRFLSLEDDRKLISFYGTDDTTEHFAGGIATRKVHLIFFAKVKELETQQHRADEEFRRKIMIALRRMSFGFKLESESVGRKESLREYTSDKIKGLITADMQPWHVCRFDFTVEYYPEEY